MKILPSLDGSLRIDLESPEDWYVLRAIREDVNGNEIDLASQLGGLVTDETIAEDWQDIVVPDLREAFADAIDYIYAAIETASVSEEDDEVKSLWITKDNASTWYSALNQARLALEETYRFGPEPDANSPEFSPHQRAALLRSEFYSLLQGFILQHILR